jgi:hypothetical protein
MPRFVRPLSFCPLNGRHLFEVLPEVRPGEVESIGYSHVCDKRLQPGSADCTKRWFPLFQFT